MDPTTYQCLCEHGSHWSPATSAHEYGTTAVKVITVRTPLGHYPLCERCYKEGHMPEKAAV